VALPSRSLAHQVTLSRSIRRDANRAPVQTATVDDPLTQPPSTEIERKFLVGDEVTEPPGGTPIRQGYLAEEGDVEVRVRITPQAATLTVKAGRGRTRTEVEVRIDPGEAESLWPHTAGRRIEKVRHRVDVPGAVAELDVYGGALAGLRVVEVEFPDAAGADAFRPPAWFGRELTGERGWSNAALARDGRPT